MLLVVCSMVNQLVDSHARGEFSDRGPEAERARLQKIAAALQKHGPVTRKVRVLVRIGVGQIFESMHARENVFLLVFLSIYLLIDRSIY